MLFRGPTAVAGEPADLERVVSGQMSHPIAVKIIDRGGQVNTGVARARNEGEYLLNGRASKVQLQMENLMMNCLGGNLLARHQSALTGSHAS